MTTPSGPIQQPPQRPQISTTDERDALDSISQMLVGSQMLKDEPGVVYSLAAQKARPQDALAIDQFMQSLDAEKQVTLARASGTQIHLDTTQRLMLDHNGVAYDDVMWTPKGAAQTALQTIADQTNGQMTAKLNPDGTLALDKNNQIQVEKVHSKSGGGWFSSFGSFAGHLGGAISGGVGDALSGIGTGISKASHFVSSQWSSPVQGVNASDVMHGNFDASHIDSTSDQVQKALGYGTDIWGTFAYAASGKKQMDVSALNDVYGPEMVNTTIGILKDPKAYKDSLLGDGANWTTDAQGQPALTADAQAKLQFLQSKDFEVLARKLNANEASFGNSIASGLGIDPIKHSTAYTATSVASDLAASFVIDPTMVALQGLKVAKMSAIGIDTLGGSDKAGSILLSNSRRKSIRDVQRGWQTGIDLTDQMRVAHDTSVAAKAAGDTSSAAAAQVKLDSLTAEFKAKLPGLAPLIPDFIGRNAFTGKMEQVVENGEQTLKPIFGDTGGIRSLEDAAKFVQSKHGLNLLMNGRAGTQTGLMPGALSAFGYRQLKGATASWMTTRSATRMQEAYSTVIARAEADPGLAEKLINEGTLTRIPAAADDAVLTTDGTILADHATQDVGTELPSAQRGQLALTDAGKGDVQRNLRRTGNALGEGVGSTEHTLTLPMGGGIHQINITPRALFSPTAIAARARLAAQRLSTMLPRNTMISLDDPRASDTIHKFGLTYLNRGDANALQSAWNFGNDGQRKAIITGILDQVSHAAGLQQTLTGRNLMARFKTAEERYMASGDEITLNGQPVAPFKGQTRQQWILPGFRDLHMASAKIGLLESTIGGPATAQAADTLMSQWKFALLFAPKTITRNQLEASLRIALEGRAGDALKSRALLTTRNQDLWNVTLSDGTKFGQNELDTYLRERGNAEGIDQMLKEGGLSQSQRTDALTRVRESKRLMDVAAKHPLVAHHLATEAGDEALAKQIRLSSMLSGQTLGRGAFGTKIANLGFMADASRVYHSMYGAFWTPEKLTAALTLGSDDMDAMARGYHQQILESDMGMRNAATHATETTKQGVGAPLVRFAPSKYGTAYREAQAAHKAGKTAEATGKEAQGVRWTHVATDNTVGAQRYVNNLHQRVDAMPETARAAIRVLRDPEAKIDEVVQALDKEAKGTAYGRAFFEDPINHPSVARDAVNESEVELGKRDWAQKIVNEYGYLLHGQNGQLQHELADYITEHGTAPDHDWVTSHMLGDDRPEAALAPEVMAQPIGGIGNFGQALQDAEGAAFQMYVEKPLQRTMSMPAMLMNYADARVGLNKQVEELVAEGFTREAANNWAKELSIKNAWVKTEQLIDDPGQKTQFDVVARNFFPFARATEAMIRRWGTGLWQNPANARKMMLAYEGAEQSGLIYNNVYGEPTFTYPGSGVLNMVMREISKIPGFPEIVQMPVASDMTGGVLMSVPGADNPFRMSMGPMLSIPLREMYKHLLPTAWRGDAMKVDSYINGPVGTGETFSQLVPPIARKFYQALSGDQRNTALGSAMSGAFANLAAAGLIPPPNASPSELQTFRSRLQTGTRNQLVLRALFGLFAPAAPSTPSEGTAGSHADYAWKIDGIKQLSDEYKSILNEVGGDKARANAVFTAMHPDEVVYDPAKAQYSEFKPTASAYETAASKSSAKGAFLPSTESALNWLASNEDFVKKYKSVSAYFLPNATTGDPFSDAAYQAQLELGLRIKKTPQEFMNDVYVKHAESLYYPTKLEFDQRIAAAEAAGDTTTADQWKQSKSVWEKEYQSINPIFKAKLTSGPDNRSTALGQLSDLEAMLRAGEVPNGQAGKLQQLIATYQNYETFIHQHSGGDEQSRAARSNALAMFNGWAQQTLTGTPLADVFNGVFVPLNTNLSQLPTQLTTTGG
jgi:hypothetical protein